MKSLSILPLAMSIQKKGPKKKKKKEIAKSEAVSATNGEALVVKK